MSKKQSNESHNLDVIHLGCCTTCGGTHLLPTTAPVSEPKEAGGKSIDDIVARMIEEMPFEISSNAIPYIKEAIRIYASQFRVLDKELAGKIWDAGFDNLYSPEGTPDKETFINSLSLPQVSNLSGVREGIDFAEWCDDNYFRSTGTISNPSKLWYEVGVDLEYEKDRHGEIASQGFTTNELYLKFKNNHP